MSTPANLGTITIRGASGSETFRIAKVITPGDRVIFVDGDGLFEFADNTADGTAAGWQRSTKAATDSERAVFKALVLANGGFDQTEVTVTPPDPAPER
jgi:hypothetical protein